MTHRKVKSLSSTYQVGFVIFYWFDSYRLSNVFKVQTGEVIRLVDQQDNGFTICPQLVFLLYADITEYLNKNT